MQNKNYYIMLVDSPWAGPTATVLSGPDIEVNDGVLIEHSQQAYSILLSVDKQADNYEDFPPCDIHGPSKSLLFSKSLIDILTQAGVDNIQYFDAKVTYEPTNEDYDYKVANVVGIVSGLDMDKSEVILSRKGNVIEIEKMFLDEDKLEGHKIFRLRESIMHIVVHKSIKDAIESAGLKGFKFVADEDYKPGML